MKIKSYVHIHVIVFCLFPYHSKQLSYCAVHCTLVNPQKWMPGLPLFLCTAVLLK